MDTYKILFWILFSLTLLIFVVNGIFTPIIRKKITKKNQKIQQEKIKKIKPGSKIILVSGVKGKVIKIKKRNFEVEIAPKVIINVDEQGILGYFQKKIKD